ncbi:MAG TPA: MMPL family transporter [Jiangellaceae bacterium]|nr:MMPL family transporter [Jiangellaceae bacterium]
MSFSTTSVARACSRHPGRTLAAWGLVLAGSITAIAFVLTGFSSEAAVTNDPESQLADERVLAGFPPDPEREVSDLIVVRSSEGLTVDDDRFRTFVDGLVRDTRQTGVVSNALAYVDVEDPSLVSADREATLIPVNIGDVDDAGEVIDVVERADADADFAVAITGDSTLDFDFNELSARDLEEGELKFGLPAALLILLLVFGTVVAGLVPLLMAMVAIATALGLVALLTQLFELSIFTTNMLTGMGLALGIDYALFVISRYREERGRGWSPDDAIVTTGGTASRAVLFSGSAFVIAMFGLLIVPSTIFRSLAAGAILVGITSLAVALTLLPALLGLLKDRVDAGRLPIVGRQSMERANPEGRIWGAIIDRVLRRPAVSLAISTAALVAIALPAFGLSIGTAGVTTLPDDLAAKQGYVALQRDFADQTVNPVHVVVANNSGAVSTALEQLGDELGADARFGPGEIRDGSGGVADLVVPVRGDPTGEQAIAAVRDLREQILPAAFEGTDADPLVGGTTSETIDYLDNVTNPAPAVFAFVLGLSLVLLTIAFRSIVIAITAILLNLLSVGAAYGLLVLVFQNGIGADLLGFQTVDTIEAWVPLFLFSVLFGLSMDYQVFLLSRIRERYDQGADTAAAVRWGVASTARIITGAALIIVAVFSGFARGDLVMFQQMGFGVAVALLIDATIIRSVLLPSAMVLLGERNWYLPRWLQWIPHLEIEGHVEAKPQPSLV